MQKRFVETFIIKELECLFFLITAKKKNSSIATADNGIKTSVNGLPYENTLSRVSYIRNTQNNPNATMA
jgi:hypothetical protein